MFSSDLENFINELAGIHSVHPDALAIILANSVAATLEFSFVLRANNPNHKVPTNLYNMIVAHSCNTWWAFELLFLHLISLAYGKSELTKLLHDSLKSVLTYRPTKFGLCNQGPITDVRNATLDEMTKAGLMSSIDGCCRMLICDEADMVFADTGIFLTHNSCRVTNETNCRGNSLFSWLDAI